LYFSSVNSTKLPNIKISEVDVSGIRSIEEVAQSRGHWDEEGKSATAVSPVYPLFMNPSDKNGMSGVAVQPQAIRTFMIRYGDAARKAQPTPIVHKPHAIIEVTASKPKSVIPVIAKKCTAGKQAAKPAKAPEKVEEEVKE